MIPNNSTTIDPGREILCNSFRVAYDIFPDEMEGMSLVRSSEEMYSDSEYWVLYMDYSGSRSMVIIDCTGLSDKSICVGMHSVEKVLTAQRTKSVKQDPIGAIKVCKLSVYDDQSLLAESQFSFDYE